MAEPSLKKNFAYKGLLTIANPIMGIITFPYISRVLGVENVGLVNFVDNTISYFLLFATMGIGSIGVRAIAAAKGSQEELDKTFSNLFGMNLLFTLVVLGVYTLLIGMVPKFSQYTELFYIGTAKILFSSLLIEWFFNGIEDFKYITVRTLLIRTLYIASVFLIIKGPQDYKLYFIMTTAVVIINAVVNLFYSRKFVRINLNQLFSSKFFKENILLGIYAIMTSMYLTFNVMYLGLVSDNVEVGYYTSAFKLYNLILSVFTAFTSVMLPRMSSLIAEGNDERARTLLNRSFDFVVHFAIPLFLCGGVLAPEIIYLLCGSGYEGAILPMRIIMPAIVFVAIAQIIAVQIIMPLKRDKVLLGASLSGAFISLIINITIVPHLHSLGSAIVLLVSEFVVTLIYVIYAMSAKLYIIDFKAFVLPLAKSIPCVLICLASQRLFANPIIVLTVSAILSVIVYMVLNVRLLRRML